MKKKKEPLKEGLGYVRVYARRHPRGEVCSLRGCYDTGFFFMRNGGAKPLRVDKNTFKIANWSVSTVKPETLEEVKRYVEYTKALEVMGDL